MISKFLYPALAICGFVVAAVVVWHDTAPQATSRPPLAGARSPFAAQTAGIGVIEANGGNIAVGTPVAGIVKTVFVRWGDHVRAGDRLFQIDDGDLRVRLPLATAHVQEAAAKLAMSRNQLALAERITDRRAISVEEVDNRRATVRIDEAALASAKAAVGEIALETRRRTILAGIEGQVMQIRVHPGEFSEAGGATPLMLIGDDSRRQVRVEIDEIDAWRVGANARAEAFMRGDPSRHVALKFERIEPYVVPKTALTGGSTERIDTRVLQVIYSFDNAMLPIHIGQTVDVFIESTPAKTAPPAAPNTAPGRAGVSGAGTAP